jgi:hypothetical protein
VGPGHPALDAVVVSGGGVAGGEHPFDLGATMCVDGNSTARQAATREPLNGWLHPDPDKHMICLYRSSVGELQQSHLGLPADTCDRAAREDLDPLSAVKLTLPARHLVSQHSDRLDLLESPHPEATAR